MRIISGTLKGKRIEPPANITARPTTDFSKESLFDILNNRVDYESLTVLDLFAGTGCVSYEFASRGCPSITSVEKNRIQSNFIRGVCRMLHLDAINLIVGDVFAYLKNCRSKFDLIFADPPYALSELSTLPDLVFEHEMLAPEGIFVLEHSKQNDFSAHPHFIEHRRYGNVNFTFFQ